MKAIISGKNEYTEQALLKQNKNKHKKDENKKSFLFFAQLLFTSFVSAALIIGNAVMGIGVLLICIEPFFSIFLFYLLWISLGVIILIPIALVNYLFLEKGVLSNLLRVIISCSLLEVLFITILSVPKLDLQLPAWLHMWSIAIWMYVFFKWITLAYGRHCKRFSVIGSLIYLFGWVGMNPDPFLKVSAKKSGQWNSSLFMRGFRNLSIGILLFLMVHYSYNIPWLLQSWIICVGLIMALHFGLFHLLAWFWQGLGYSVKPIMFNPLASRKISEFWGGRWNIAFNHIVFPFLFTPLKKKLGLFWGVFFTFLFSGLVHELVISLPAGAGYGLPTIYFLIQAIGIYIERINLRWLPKRVFTYIVIAGPIFILFHPPFMKEVIIPFVTALGTLKGGIMEYIKVIIDYFNLKEAIFLAGLLHLGVLVAGVMMTKVLRWQKELKKINKLSEHIVWTHGIYVLFTVLFFGVISLLWPDALFDGHIFGIVLSVFITFFWGLRLFIQFFYFDPKPYLTNVILKMGFHSLTLSFLYFTIVYGWSAYTGIMG